MCRGGGGKSGLSLSGKVFKGWDGGLGKVWIIVTENLTIEEYFFFYIYVIRKRFLVCFTFGLIASVLFLNACLK